MQNNTNRPWQARLHDVIYESNTTAGKTFDIALLLLIIASIGVVMLDSVESYNQRYGHLFFILEITFTILFTIEYILRLVCIKKPLLYMISFLGIIDLLAIIPGYLSIFFVGAQSLLVLRALRLLRIFRIFKLTHFLSEMNFLGTAIRGSLKKITIFMLIVITLVIILGSVMYLVEKDQNSAFQSIPDSVYWAIVTITTVGYGDISPITPQGKLVASLIMLMGYGIIAVPTGIITTEMAMAARRKEKNETCPHCGKEGHDYDARFCKSCGGAL